MKLIKDSNHISKTVSKLSRYRDIYNAGFYVSNLDQSIDQKATFGNMSEDTKYYIASVNKLFVSAIVLKLISQGIISFNTKLVDCVGDIDISGIHRFDGKDFTDKIEVEHLLSQTSGLPCYLTETRADYGNTIKDMIAGKVEAWPIDRVVSEIKKMKSHYEPGAIGKANYIDTNHQLLSLAIECITGKGIRDILEDLFSELDMKDTYVCYDEHDDSYSPIFHRSEIKKINKFLVSTNNDIISTLTDQMKFIKAFIQGHFYPQGDVSMLYKWRRIFFPFENGVGIQRFRLPRILSPFKQAPSLIGQCGSTGAGAFYVEDLDVYIVGTTNQNSNPGASFGTMLRILS